MIYHGDCLEVLRTLPSESVHCCVTSPPYWGLRDYGHDGQLGLEKSPEEYVSRMVDVFREVRRVLRDDGTLWLNIGDSYANSGGMSQPHRDSCGGIGNKGTRGQQPFHASGGGFVRPSCDNLKPKDLCGIPWRLAFALQSDGWYLRQDIIWHKPNPMPESVRDRCTKAHEYVFLMSKSARYYWDAEAVKEANSENSGKWGKMVPTKTAKAQGDHGKSSALTASMTKQECIDKYYTNGRNRRSVWTIATQPCKEAHFAVMPQKLVEPCILAGCPERCCVECGGGWIPYMNGKPYNPEIVGNGIRAVDASRQDKTRKLNGKSKEWKESAASRRIVGYKPSCQCGSQDTKPGTVLDPFFGAGTVGLVATKLGRNYVGIELNPAYIKIAEKRIGQELDRMPLLEAVR